MVRVVDSGSWSSQKLITFVFVSNKFTRVGWPESAGLASLLQWPYNGRSSLPGGGGLKLFRRCTQHRMARQASLSDAMLDDALQTLDGDTSELDEMLNEALVAVSDQPTRVAFRGIQSEANKTMDWNQLQQRGVSVHHLATDFVSSAMQAGPFLRHRCTENGGVFCRGPAEACPAGAVEVNGREATVHEIKDMVINSSGEHLVCPRDGRTGSAYVDTIGDEAAGPASYMLSYTWGYKVGQIVDALVAYCERCHLDTRTTYVWMCCVCINQHRVKERSLRGEVVPPQEFRDVFEGRIRGIGHVLSLFAPWSSPANLTRTWCLFEIWMALRLEQAGHTVMLEIIMPPSEQAAFEHSFSITESVYDVLSHIDVENSQATVPADKEAIMALVREDMGVVEMNQAVHRRLKEWCTVTAKLAFSRLSEEKQGNSFLGIGLAKILHEQGKFDEATLFCRDLLRTYQSLHGDRHMMTMFCALELSSVLNDQGKYDEATLLHKQNLKHLFDNCHEFLKLFDSMPRELPAPFPAPHQVHGAMKCMMSQTMAQTGFGTANGTATEASLRDEVSSTRAVLDRDNYFAAQYHFCKLTQLGDLLSDEGRLDEAEEFLREAYELSCYVNGRSHSQTTTASLTLLNLLQNQGNLEEAELLAREVVKVERTTHGENHPATLNAINSLAVVLMKQGRLDEAELLFQEVLAQHFSIHADPNHIEYLNMQGNLGLLLMRRHSPEGAAMVRSVLENLKSGSHKSHAIVRKFEAALEGSTEPMCLKE